MPLMAFSMDLRFPLMKGDCRVLCRSVCCVLSTLAHSVLAWRAKANIIISFCRVLEFDPASTLFCELFHLLLAILGHLDLELIIRYINSANAKSRQQGCQVVY